MLLHKYIKLSYYTSAFSDMKIDDIRIGSNRLQRNEVICFEKKMIKKSMPSV